MRKTIAITYNTSWYIYIFRMSLIKELQKCGYEVLTIAPEDDYTQKLIEAGCRHISVSLDSRSKNPFKDLNTVFSFIKIFKQEKPDVVLNFTAKANIYGTLASHYLGIPTINNIAGLGTGFVNETITTKILRGLYRFSQKKATKVFFQNSTDFDEFVKYNLVRSEQCEVLPGSGVDLNRFEQKELKLLKGEAITFLLISRMLFSKGVNLLVEAANKLAENDERPFKIQLLGDIGVNSNDAIPRSLIEKWTEKPNIEYLGRTDDVRPHLENCHCFILPTYYREGTPRSILEAMATGRPIITTDTPGCRDTVTEGKNGFLIQPKSSDEITSALRKFLQLNSNEIMEMGKSSRRLVEEKFNEKIIIDKYISSVKKIVG